MPPLILIVDDNPENLRLLGNALQARKYRLIFAKNGPQALDVLKKQKADLILLDIMMPEMDGFAVCQKLKQDATTKEIPVIFLTAQKDNEKVLKGFKLGAVDYVTKPFNTEELITRVETHIKLQTTETQLKQKVEELASTVEQLKEANSTKDKFFSIIAHDLGNLFGGTIGLLELVITEQLTPKDQEKFLHKIMQSSENGHNLLKNLLEWSRVQTGKIKAQPKALNIDAVAQYNIDFLTFQAAQKNINILSDIEKTQVLADENMLNTVLRNLLSNAIKFTPENGRVEVSAKKKNAVIELSIKDTGIGIPSKHIDELFRIEVNYSREGTAGEQGTGLGLILCKEFVEKNGGTIGVESEEGKGSRFYIQLPLP